MKGFSALNFIYNVPMKWLLLAGMLFCGLIPHTCNRIHVYIDLDLFLGYMEGLAFDSVRLTCFLKVSKVFGPILGATVPSYQGHPMTVFDKNLFGDRVS